MTDIITRLRAEDPECGLRLSIASEAADRIEELERFKSLHAQCDKTSLDIEQKLVNQVSYYYARMVKMEVVLRHIAERKSDPCDKYCGHFLDMQALAADALKGME
jgi:hypothetical protein